MLKKILLTVSLVLAPWIISAQITAPNTFSPGQTILASQVNANFAKFSDALNRTGGTMTGTLTARDIAADTTATYDIGTSSTKFRAGYFSGTLTAGTFSGSAASLTAVPAAQVTGNLPLAQYSEAKNDLTISAGALTFDLSTGTYFKVPLNANVTSITISNPPSSGRVGSFTVSFVADGTARTITWPASVKWSSGTAPTPTSTNTKVDIYSFFTYDGGTTYYAFISGQNF